MAPRRCAKFWSWPREEHTSIVTGKTQDLTPIFRDRFHRCAHRCADRGLGDAVAFEQRRLCLGIAATVAAHGGKDERCGAARLELGHQCLDDDVDVRNTAAANTDRDAGPIGDGRGNFRSGDLHAHRRGDVVDGVALKTLAHGNHARHGEIEAAGNVDPGAGYCVRHKRSPHILPPFIACPRAVDGVARDDVLFRDQLSLSPFCAHKVATAPRTSERPRQESSSVLLLTGLMRNRRPARAPAPAHLKRVNTPQSDYRASRWHLPASTVPRRTGIHTPGPRRSA